MRLFEADNRFIDDLTAILRNEIGLSDNKRSPKSLSWIAFSNLLSPLGFGKIDYGTWSKILDINPELKPYVRNFNQDSIELGTKEEPLKSPNEVVPTSTGPSIDQMANRAVSKGLQPDFK
jgi:hypothetical protein